ncbi:MAG: hypothetical protein EOM14_15910, partial [Clostridia bacterium]|nr:hypothetical protein [Clostridia bacterium]
MVFEILAVSSAVAMAFFAMAYNWRLRHIVYGVAVAVISMTVFGLPLGWLVTGLSIVATIGSWTVEQKKTVRVIGLSAAVAVALGVPALVAPSPESTATAATQYVKIPDSGSREQVEGAREEVILKSASSEEPVSGFDVLGDNLEFNTLVCDYQKNDPDDYSDDTMIPATSWIIVEEDCLPNLTPEKRADYLAHFEEGFGFAEGTGRQQIRALADWQRANPDVNMLAIGVFN